MNSVKVSDKDVIIGSRAVVPPAKIVVVADPSIAKTIKNKKPII